MSQFKPNLFVVGSMKSGTSSLHFYLDSHPKVFMSRQKEPSYFVRPEQLVEQWPELAKLGYWRREDNYLQLFEAAGEAEIIGESSTNYSKLGRIDGVARRIAAFNPRARIIYVMRDPIERTISHYWHAVRFDGEQRGLTEALVEDPHYREVSHYAMQLEPYLCQFGRDNVYTLTFEEMVSDRVDALQRVFGWLGVDAAFVPPNLGALHNATPTEFFNTRSLFNRIRESSLWQKIGPYSPLWLRDLGFRLSATRIRVEKVSTRKAVNFLRPIQREETAILSDLLQREFPEWSMLYTEYGSDRPNSHMSTRGRDNSGKNSSYY